MCSRKTKAGTTILQKQQLNLRVKYQQKTANVSPWNDLDQVVDPLTELRTTADRNFSIYTARISRAHLAGWVVTWTYGDNV